MSVRFLKSLERNVRRLIRRKKYKNSSATADEKFYWHISHIFSSVLGDGRATIIMPPDQSNSVLVHCDASNVRLKFTSATFDKQTSLEQFENGSWTLVGNYEDRQGAILKGLKVLVAAKPVETGELDPFSRNNLVQWVPIENGRRVAKMLNLGEQWTTSLHRSGWGFALDPLKSLHDDKGVIFDGFLESTFCWKDSGQEYLKPWVGVIHNPPRTPAWANDGKATNKHMLNTKRWINSRKNCKGIFVLSEYHKRHLEKRLDIPISVLCHPTETPKRKFSFSEFENNANPMLVQVGHWLRNPNSLYQLESSKLTKARLDVGHPWEENSRKHLPAENLDLASVKLIPRLGDFEYDELLAKNIVFLDLLDSSANNAVIECIVRNTPILVNRIEPVVEHLGEAYPFYFENLEEAARKADDFDLIHRTHQYLSAMQKEQFGQQAFLHSVIQSDVYQSLLPSALDNVVLLAHARSGSSTLHQILDAHHQFRMAYEPFNSTRPRWKQYDYRSQVVDDASLDRCLDEIFYYFNGMKHLFYQLDERQNELLLQRDARRIFLNRENLLQTVVSGLIAEQTRKWAGNGQEILKAKLTQLDPQTVSDRIQWLRKNINRYRQFMIENDIKYFEVKYEELYGEDLSTLAKMHKISQIFEYLGAVPPGELEQQKILQLINPNISKINSTETYQRIPNVEKLERQLGCAENGFLFPESPTSHIPSGVAA